MTEKQGGISRHPIIKGEQDSAACGEPEAQERYLPHALPFLWIFEELAAKTKQ